MKDVLRREILIKRNKMTKIEVEDKSKKIIEILIKSNDYLNSQYIYVYVSKGNEVATKELINISLDKCKNVFIPKVNGSEILFYQISNLSDCIKGKFDILEPLPLAMEGEDKTNSIIIVPGIVFDNNRNRVGYGKGYFDKYLAKNKFEKIIGLAYDFQVINGLKPEKHDIGMDMIITESRII